MLTQPILTKTQKYYLTFTLALTLTMAWSAIAHADGPGDLDVTFGGSGIVTDSISSGPDAGLSIAIQQDNKIVVAGVGDMGSDNATFAVVRYNSDGSHDTTFNNTGVVTTLIDTGSWGFSTAIQPDGKIVVAGNSGRLIQDGVFDYAFAVARYHITGTLDTDFNNTGIVTTSIGNGFERGWSVALQPDGKIVVAGEYEALSMFNNIAVVRYNITGTLDTNFSETGILTTSLVSNGPTGVAVQPDGKIVVASYGLVRFTITGTLDTSFNGTGLVTTPGFSASSLELLPDGKIVAAGSSSDNDFAVARYNSDGSPDTTFNGTGIITTPITSEYDYGLSVAIQPNGKIVVAGFNESFTGGAEDIVVVRYNSDGALDTTFGSTGVVTTPVSSASDAAFGVAIQPDGKIVAAGYGDLDTPNTTFVVVRYLGGELDQTYLPVVLKN